jgi:hypothetical protein
MAMWNRTSIIAPALAGFFVLILVTAVWAVKITLFMDTDTFIARAKDIVIVEAADVPKAGSGIGADGLYPVDIDILMPLKGDKSKGKTTLATIYPIEKGKRYMISSLGGSAFGTDLLGLPELSVVPLSANLDLKGLEGKALKEQVLLVFQQRLADVNFAQKRLSEERILLERATGPQRALWAALTVPEPVLSLDRADKLQASFALMNDTNGSLDPKVGSWILVVDGIPCLDSGKLLGDGPRDQRWKSLPAGDCLRFGYRLGDLFKTPGTYTISWEGDGFESAPVEFRVVK